MGARHTLDRLGLLGKRPDRFVVPAQNALHSAANLLCCSPMQQASAAEDRVSPATPGASPVIEVLDVHKSFGPLEVLKGVTVTAREGEVVALIGSSGSGKSTLLRCINMLEIPEQGSVRIAGEEIALSSPGPGRRIADETQIRRIRSELGMVFQSFNLWSHMSVIENVMEAPLHVQKRDPAEVEREADEMLRKVGIEGKATSYPAQLSGGQQQRAAIARALCINPKVMLFDEPTSALDPELQVEVVRVIKLLADEGRTMLLVTHDMDLAKSIADRVVFLHLGKIEEEGSVDEVFGATRSERLKQFLGAAGHG
jgi:ABC-type histidine transport system ATPase subunit